MHQVKLTDAAFDRISDQAFLLGLTVEQTIEQAFAAPETTAAPRMRELLGRGTGRGAFASKESISQHVRALRREWAD